MVLDPGGFTTEILDTLELAAGWKYSPTTQHLSAVEEAMGSMISERK